MNELTLIIPAKNEKESLPSVLKELKDYIFSPIIIIVWLLLMDSKNLTYREH